MIISDRSIQMSLSFRNLQTISMNQSVSAWQKFQVFLADRCHTLPLKHQNPLSITQYSRTFNDEFLPDDIPPILQNLMHLKQLVLIQPFFCSKSSLNILFLTEISRLEHLESLSIALATKQQLLHISYLLQNQRLVGLRKLGLNLEYYRSSLHPLEEFFEGVSGMERLEELSLGNFRLVQNKCLDKLNKTSTLRVLLLKGCSFQDKNMSSIRLPELNKLTLDSCGLSSKEANKIFKEKREDMTSLCLQNNHIQKVNKEWFIPQRLLELNIMNNPIDNESIITLIKKSPELKVLRVGGKSSGVNDEVLESVGMYLKVSQFEINSGEITNTGVQNFIKENRDMSKLTIQSTCVGNYQIILASLYLRKLTFLKIEAWMNQSQINDSMQRLCGISFSSLRLSIIKNCILNSDWIGDIGFNKIIRNLKGLSQSSIETEEISQRMRRNLKLIGPNKIFAKRNYI